MSNSSKMPHGFARLIIGDGSAVSEQKNIIWNMIGSFLYAFASMVLSIAVVQLAGEDAGGVFTFAFTTFGQHMFMAAYFGIRPFQITDTGEKYTFGDYLGLRLITCGLAILVGFGYVMVSGYTFEKAVIVFLMVVYKVIDALADTYEAEFQRGGRLYLTGKSNAFRTILHLERAKANNLHLIALGQAFGDDFNNRIQRQLGVLLGELGLFSKGSNQFGLIHGIYSSLFARFTHR